MDRISYFADLSVRRGCAFALLGITTFMIGFANDLLLSLKVGAVLTTLMDVILLMLATWSLRRDYRGTELWVLLGKEHGLSVPDERAGEIIRRILHDTLLRYSRLALAAAIALWLLFLLVWAHRAL